MLCVMRCIPFITAACLDPGWLSFALFMVCQMQCLLHTSQLCHPCWRHACAGEENAHLTAELAAAKQQAHLLLQQQQASQQQVSQLQQQLAGSHHECSTLRAALAAAERDFKAALERNASLVQAEVQHMQEVLQVRVWANTGTVTCQTRSRCVTYACTYIRVACTHVLSFHLRVLTTHGHALQEVREAEQQMVAAVSQQAAGQQTEEERSTGALAAEASQVSTRSTGSVRQQFSQLLAQEQRRAVTAEAQLEVARQQCLGLQVRPTRVCDCVGPVHLHRDLHDPNHCTCCLHSHPSFAALAETLFY